MRGSRSGSETAVVPIPNYQPRPNGCCKPGDFWSQPKGVRWSQFVKNSRRITNRSAQ